MDVIGVLSLLAVVFLEYMTCHGETMAGYHGYQGMLNVSHEQRLMRNLMFGYEKAIRPVINSSTPVTVRLGLTLTQILDLDEKNQVLTTNVWMEVIKDAEMSCFIRNTSDFMYKMPTKDTKNKSFSKEKTIWVFWNGASNSSKKHILTILSHLINGKWDQKEWYDEKLRWNSDDYGGTGSIRIPSHNLWVPDVVLYNSVDDYTSGYMQALAMVYEDGRVFWGPVVRMRSSCKIDITYFPFDDQTCKLKLGSWAYHGFMVDVTNRSATIDLSNFVDNGEWELIQVRVERNTVFYNCCPEPFPDVTFYMLLRRRIKYYFMNIIIPCIILSFLCLAGFLLPPESGEKITLGLSVLLTITVFMLMVADKMPQTSESISVISIYLMVVLTMSCLSVLTSVWILSIHHQRGKPKRVPKWLRTIIFRVVAVVFCIKIRQFSGRKSDKETKLKKLKLSRIAMEDPEIIRMERISDIDQDYASMEADCYRDSPIDRDESLKTLIDVLRARHLTDMNDEEIFKEWRDVAFVLDRMFFVVFLLVTTVSTVCILEMRPGDITDT